MSGTPAVRRQSESSETFRTLEVAVIGLFVALSVALLIINPTRTAGSVTPGQPSPGVTVQANAMPHQGWAPMTTYFSAFGSESANGEIVAYEWDLDGNGHYDTDATDEAGYASYTYAKPGEYQITLRVTDEHGGTATDSLTITVRHPASSPVDYWTVFDDSRVRRVDIFMVEADWDAMWVDPELKLTVPVDATVFGERLENVGFRMRGQFSLRESREKKPWKIDTDFYIDGQEYRNLRQLMFINNLGDPSMIQEKLTYDMLAFAGVPASHVCFVELWIDITDDDEDSTFWGVYTMVERVDKKFLASRFGNDNDHGNLYKASHAQRGPMDLVYHGDDIKSYPTHNGQYAYGKMTNEEEDDYSDVIDLARVIDGTTYSSPEQFALALEEVFEVDAYLRYEAVMNAVASWDYYAYTGNNYFLYHNPATEKMDWIPWDQTWGEDPYRPIFGRTGVGLAESTPLFDRVFEVEEYRWKYAAYLDLLVRFWFNSESIFPQAQAFHSLIDPYVRQSTGDKMFFGDTPSFEYQAFQTGWRGLAEFAGTRSTFILQELAKLERPAVTATEG